MKIRELQELGNDPVIVDAGDLLFSTKNINNENRKSEVHRAKSIMEGFNKIGCDAINVGQYEMLNGLKFLNHGLSDIIINGPISKKHYLEKKYPGITEFIFDKADQKISQNPVMLIYNKKFSVSPVTTHIPLKNVHKKINEKLIVKNILLIHNFYRKYLHIKPKIAVVGLNPHCESNSKFNEDIKIITPAVRKLKNKNIKISGPFSADTFFLNENVEKYNSVVGMYHDQVLTPFKTIFEFDASNITLGLPFLRMSVDHGPNVKMLGKNKSNTGSLENIFKLINSLK